MERIPVKDPKGNTIGHIEQLDGGDQVLRDGNDVIRGYYDAQGDYTRDAERNILAKGNKLRSLMC